MNYYNENDPKTAAWLRELMKEGLIPDGQIDTRSIVEVQPGDLEGFNQCHFFAGIAGWPYALQLASVPEDFPLWTGSCPCQPFSAAGKRKGTDDHRHLWPEFFRLIAARNPSVVLGEQVASPDGRKWLTGVRADLEALAYDFGAADLCSAGVAAPHNRARLFWVAYSNCHAGKQRGSSGQSGSSSSQGEARAYAQSGRCGLPCGLDNSQQQGLEGFSGDGDDRNQPGRLAAETVGPASAAGRSGISGADWMGNSESNGRRRGTDDENGRRGQLSSGYSSPGSNPDVIRMGNTKGRGCGIIGDEAQPGCSRHPDSPNFWSNYDIAVCDDLDRAGRKKFRRVEAGTFPLAHGIPARMGRLRGYGNAINPILAAVFIRAAFEAWQARFGTHD